MMVALIVLFLMNEHSGLSASLATIWELWHPALSHQHLEASGALTVYEWPDEKL